MKEYNPKIVRGTITNCVCWNWEFGFCENKRIGCPKYGNDKKPSIPTDCPARGEGILIQVKE